jgi:hypothetical protein
MAEASLCGQRQQQLRSYYNSISMLTAAVTCHPSWNTRTRQVAIYIRVEAKCAHRLSFSLSRLHSFLSRLQPDPDLCRYNGRCRVSIAIGWSKRNDNLTSNWSVCASRVVVSSIRFDFTEVSRSPSYLSRLKKSRVKRRRETLRFFIYFVWLQ